MKIAICSPVSLTNFSGAARFLIDISNLLANRGHNVEFYALPFGPNKTISLAEVQDLLPKVTYHEARRIYAETDIAYVNYTPLMWRRIKIRGKTIAGLHTPLILPKQHIVETLIHPRDAGYEWYTKAVGFALLLPLLKIDLTLFDAVHIPITGFGLFGQQRIYEIPLWIDINTIPQIETSKFEKFTILFVGRKAWEKGWLAYRKIASTLRRSGYDFEFVCTGKGCGEVKGLGFLNDEELFEVYQRSHVVVYPSVADVFSLVILEAAACGVPLITTPIDAHVNQGLPLLYSKNIDDFIKAILRVNSVWKERPERYFALSKNLRDSAGKYSINGIFPKFERMFEKTVGD